MASKDKGKQIAGTGSSAGGKRKHSDGKSGGGSRKRKNPGVLQFFEYSAAEADASDDSDLDGRYPISDFYFGYAFLFWVRISRVLEMDLFEACFFCKLTTFLFNKFGSFSVVVVVFLLKFEF